jgi:prevent-host-death family protein
MIKQKSPPERTVGSGEFKARCLELMKEVQERHEPLVVTRRGKPIVRILPVVEGSPQSFGALAGTVRYTGDIVAPDVEDWGENA